MDLNNLILFFVLFGLGLFFYKYFIVILDNHYPKLLVDDQLNKPQAFHELPIPIVGGAVLFFSFLVIYFNFLIFKNIFFLDYLLFCTLTSSSIFMAKIKQIRIIYEKLNNRWTIKQYKEDNMSIEWILQ